MYLNRSRITAVLCAIALAVFAVPVFGATLIWNDATGNWFTAGNWTPAGPPGASDDAQINNGGTAQIASAGATADFLSLGRNSSDSGTLDISGTGTLNVAGNGPFVGYSGTGTLNITSGGKLTCFDLEIGLFSGSVGVTTVDGAGSHISAVFIDVASSGTGTLNIKNGATVSSGSSDIAIFGTGIVNVDGAGSKWTISSGDLSIATGSSATGTLNITNGGAFSDTDATSRIRIGNGGTGVANVDGAGSTLTSSGDVAVAEFGTGTLNVTNGGSVSDVNGFIGGASFAFGAPGFGTANIDGSGSTWTNSGDLSLGFFTGSTGTLNITNGGAVTSVNGVIGHNAGSSGTVTVNGAGSMWTNSGNLTVGNNGTGTLNIQSGGAVSNAQGFIGRNSGSIGTATVDGAGSTWTNSSSLFVGNDGAGTLNVTNGGVVSSGGQVFFGTNTGSNGTGLVDGTGSQLNAATGLIVGDSGTGMLTISNGGVAMSGTSIGIGDFAAGQVTVTGAGSSLMSTADLTVGAVSTGTLMITSGGAAVNGRDGFLGFNPGANGTVTVDGTGSTWTNTRNLYVGGNTLGPGGTGLLHITNSGTVSALTTTVWSGGTVIDDASLVSPSVSVMTGGLLAGTGTVFGDVSNSGTVSPGDSPGTLTITGNYTQNSGGTLKIEIGGLNSGVNSDLLQVNGAGGASLDGTLQLVRINNFRPLPGDRVTIINDGSGHTGTFSTLDLVNWGLLQPVPMYNEPTDVYVVFELAGTFQSQGETPNQRAVGHAIDQAFSDECLSSNVLGFLGSIPVPDLPHAFDLIAPEELAAMYEISFSRAIVQSENLQHRMDQIRDNADPNCGALVETNPPIQEGKNVVSKNVAPPAPAPAPDNRWGTFAMGSGQYVTVHNQDDNADGYRITNGSFLAGVDYRVLHNLAIGVYGGYVGSESDLVGRGRITTDGGTVGGYATFFSHGFYLQGAGGGGWNRYDNLREALLGGAHGSTNGSEVNAMGAIGYDWSMNFNAANHPGSLTIGPIASVQYTNVDIDRYSEHGSLIPLEFPDQSEDSLRSTIGGKVAICIQTDHGIMLRPEARVAWLHEYNDRAYPIDARFIGCPDIFTVHGPRIGADAAQVNAGVTVQFNPMVALYAHYDGLFGRNNYDSNAVSGGLALSF